MAAAVAQFTSTSKSWMQGFKPTWCYAWFVVEAGVVALMLAFQCVAALPVLVARFVVTGAMPLFSFQALPGGWSLPVPELGSRDDSYCQSGGSAPASPSEKLRAHGCRGRDTGCPVPPSQIPACSLARTGLFARTRLSGAPVRLAQVTPPFLRIGFPVERFPRVASFATVGACALPAATMKRSDSQSCLGLSFLSLDTPTRLALVVSAAGQLWVSLVPSSSFFTRHALRPRQASARLTLVGAHGVGCHIQNGVPTCGYWFRGCIA